MTQNLSSTNPGVRAGGDRLFSGLEEVVMSESGGSVNGLIMPVTNQVNLHNCRVKAQLVQRLANMVRRVDKAALVERYCWPLVNPSNKIQQEANGN